MSSGHMSHLYEVYLENPLAFMAHQNCAAATVSSAPQASLPRMRVSKLYVHAEHVPVVDSVDS